MMRAIGYKGTGGLGKREDGTVEHVRVRFRRDCDKRGLGTRDAKASSAVFVGEKKPPPPMTKGTNGMKGTTRVETSRDMPMAAEVVRAKAEAKARRDANVAETLYRAFRDDDCGKIEGGDGFASDESGSMNPLLNKKRRHGALTASGMSRTNPLRKFADG